MSALSTEDSETLIGLTIGQASVDRISASSRDRNKSRLGAKRFSAFLCLRKSLREIARLSLYRYLGGTNAKSCCTMMFVLMAARTRQNNVDIQNS
jgi:enolase